MCIRDRMRKALAPPLLMSLTLAVTGAEPTLANDRPMTVFVVLAATVGVTVLGAPDRPMLGVTIDLNDMWGSYHPRAIAMAMAVPAGST